MTPETLPPPQEQQLTTSEVFDQWQASLERLSSEMPQLQGTKELPEWWYEKGSLRSEAKQHMKIFGVHDGDVARFYDLYQKEQSFVADVYEREKSPYDNHPFQDLLYTLGAEVVAEGMELEQADGPLHMAFVDALESAQGKEDRKSKSIFPELELLRKMYNKTTATELLSIGGDDYSVRVRDLLLDANALRQIRHEDSPYDSDATWKENKEKTRKWLTEAIAVSSGLSKEEAINYSLSVSRRSDEDDIAKVLRTIDYFGADRLSVISERTGIYGLEAYTIEQLERMERLAVDSEAVANELANHDVTVVLVNRSGDHNGVMVNSSEIFEDSENTLFFEINAMSDIYRRMSYLHKFNIKPSTIVLAAHSNKGQFMVSDERDPSRRKLDIATVAGTALVERANNNGDLEESEKGYAIRGMKGFARLVEEYMQPSRGLDDDESNIGRKKIIFQACYAGAETEVFDLDKGGEKMQVGMESVVSQLGKDLLASDISSSVDVYGAPAAIQMHRTEKGVRYSGPPDGTMERTKLHAVQIRLEDKQIHQQDVDEIPLRKAS